MSDSKVATGDIVKFIDQVPKYDRGGYYRVTSVRGGKANLGSIFGKTIYHKRIPISELTECHSEWYAKWSQSETYHSM